MPRPPKLRTLALAYAGLAAVAYVLIVLGALVRAHDAGLSCPDWPLCHGQVVPRFDEPHSLRGNLESAGILAPGQVPRYAIPLQVALEWGHRALVGVMSLGVAAASLAVFLDREARRRAGALAATVLVVLAVQIVLGGLTVLELLARWTVTSHLLTGNLFAVTLVLTSLSLGRAPEGERVSPSVPASVSARLRLATVVTSVLLVVQLALGGLVASSYAGLACTEWPACNQGVWFPTFEGNVGLQVLHRLGAYALAAAAVLMFLAARPVPSARRLATAALGLVLLQVCVGVANVLLYLPVPVTALHSAVAAALVGVTAVLATRVFPARGGTARSPALPFTPAPRETPVDPSSRALRSTG